MKEFFKDKAEQRKFLLKLAGLTGLNTFFLLINNTTFSSEATFLLDFLINWRENVRNGGDEDPTVLAEEAAKINLITSELLGSSLDKINSSEQLRQLLNTLPFDSPRCGIIFNHIKSGEGRGMIERFHPWLCEIVLKNYKSDIESARYAAAILTGVAPLKNGYGKEAEDELRDLIHAGIQSNDLLRLGVIESLCYVYSIIGNRDVTKKFQRFMLSNPDARAIDGANSLSHYSGNLDIYLAACKDYLRQITKSEMGQVHFASRAIHLINANAGIRNSNHGDELATLVKASLEWDAGLGLLAKNSLNRHDN